MTTPAFWILFGGCVAIIGALVTAIGTFWNTSKQERDKTQAAIQRANYEQESREKSDHIAALNEQIAKDQRGLRIKADEQLQLQTELRKKSDEIAELNRQIAAKSDEIATLNRDIAASITGGDSICYFNLLDFSFQDNSDTARLVLVHLGKYPLYEIQARIIDPVVFNEVAQKAHSVEDIFKTESHLNLGNLASNQSRIGQFLRIRDGQAQDYTIFFGARNGFWVQKIRLKRIAGHWTVAIRVTGRDNSDKVYFERIDPTFPRNSQGEVEWHP